MKNLAKFFMAVAIFAGITSCVQDATVDEGGFLPTETITISVAESRTHLGEKDGDSYPVYWSTGDQVSINGISSDPLGETAEGSVKGLFNFTGLLEPTYKASYPATAEAGKVYFAPEQTYVAGTFSEGAAVLYGESETLVIQMQHASGVLKFPIKVAESEEVSLKRVVIENVNGKLAGEYSAELVDGEVVLTPSESATSKIVYDCGNVALSTEPTNLFIAVPAGEYAELKVSLISTDNRIMNFKVTATGEKVIKAGIVREFNKVNHISFTGNETTFQITDSESLMEFAELCAKGDFLYSGAKVMNDFTFDSATYTWAPVTGFVDDLEFDGGDFTITGLPNALFDVANGNIHNLKLNSTVVLSDENAHHGLLANQFSGTVTDCEVSGSIEHTALKDVADVAGVVGAAGGKLVFTNVANKASVKATFVQDATPKLAGILATSGATGALEFINCSNSGAIETVATSGVTTKATHIGGIFGFVDDYAGSVFVKGCSNSGNITSNHDLTSELCVGGIYGANQSPLTTELYNEAYNTNAGDITINGTSTSSFAVGGCIGRIEKANSVAKYFKNLEGADLLIAAQNTVRMDFGGVVGHLNIKPSTVEDCYNYGTVTYAGTMEGAGAGYYSPTIGGVVGRINQAGHTVKNCHNYGVVECTSTATFKRFKIGGVLAYSEGGALTVENCSNNHDLTFSGTTGGVFYAGGVVGHTDSTIASVKDLVNNNKITVNGQGGSGYYVGGVYGLIGNPGSTISCSDLTNNGEIVVNANVTSAGAMAGGVIGCCQAVATNLTNNGKVTFNGTASNYYIAGGVVGYLQEAASGLSNTKEVTFAGTASTKYVATGGVVGSAANLTVKDDDVVLYTAAPTITLAEGKTYAAENSGTLSFGGTSTTEYYAGGIVGLNAAAQATVFENTGNISFTGAAGTVPYVGGVIGYTSGDILPAEGKEVAAKNSAETFTIGGTSASYFYFGGVIGKSHIANISGLTNESDITVTHTSTVATTAQFNGVGGVVGWTTTFNGWGDPGSATKLNATSLRNSGDLTYNGVTTSGTTALCASGVVGFSNGMLLDGLYNTGVITIGANANVKAGAEIDFGGCLGQGYFGQLQNAYNGDENDTTHEKGKIYLAYKKNKAHFYTGGVSGYIRIYSMTHQHHYNYAKIECANDFTAGGNRLRLGGVHGWVYKTPISEAHNYGPINLSATATNAYNQLYIGGVAGRNDQGYTGQQIFSTLSNSATINVDVVATAGAAKAIGGIFGTAEFAGTHFTGMTSTGNITVTARALDGSTGTVGIGGLIGVPTKAITVDKCTVNCSIVAPHANVAMAVGIAYGGYATVTNSSFDGFIQRGDDTEQKDIKEDDFFNYIYTSAWGGDSDYAGNTGVKTEGGDSTEDLG